MKKLFILLTVSLSFSFSSKAQYVTIPDDGFKAFLLARYPTCFNGSGELDTTCTAITTEDSLAFHGLPNTTNYAALAYFDGLKYLDCSGNTITLASSMPAQLPGGLLTLIANHLIGYANSSEFLISRMPATLQHVDYSNNHYTSFSGRVWPAALKYIDLSFNAFNADPGTLPAGLDTFICATQDGNLGAGSFLNTLSNPLPVELKYFDCSENSFLSVPVLPATLTYLDCSFQYFFAGLSMSVPVQFLDALPVPLPPSLVTLKCKANAFTALPALPASLQRLECGGQQFSITLEGITYENAGLSELPVLPAGLKYLNCGGDGLSSLPALPANLEYLNYGGNNIGGIPALPATLQSLNFSANPISAIGSLPPLLNYLNCSNTGISCLPHLPETMTGPSAYNSGVYNIEAGSTNINCLPNYVPGMHVNAGSILPLCNATNNTHGCEINPVIGGFVFYDLNSNGIQDAGELPRADVRLDLNGTAYNFTDINGHYEFTAPIGNNVLTVQPPQFYNTVPASFNHTVSSNNTVITDTVALQPTIVFDSVKITITPSANPRQNKPLTYYIHYENIGTTAVSTAVTINYDNSNLIYNSSSNGAVIQAGNTLTLSPGVLQPGQGGSFSSTFTVKVAAVPGTVLTGIANITGGSNSCTDSALSVVLAAIDPNDKQATPALTLEQVSQGTFINYLIRFQNAGTVSALNVFITDTLTNMLQENTLEMISASHTCKVTLTGNKLLCEFLNINLPDSTTNESASHGFIRFRVKPLNTLTANTIVLNKASIYFDYNSAVVTNDAITAIGLDPVPLTLLDFKGTAQPGNKVLLQWKTTGEINTSRFEIQQSQDSRQFSYVTTEKAIGSGDNAYLKTLALTAATVYYRLGIIDIDGRTSYSSIVKVSAGKNPTGLSVLDNPARNELNINVTDNTLANTKAVLINSQGLLVRSFILTTSLQHINIADLTSGVYYLHTKNGAEKIVVSH